VPQTQKNVFERHPKKILIAVVLVLIPLTDILFTYCTKAIFSYSHKDHNNFRTKLDIFHHGFKPGMAQPRALWGPLVYPVYTNSLGFIDASPRVVPLRTDRYRILLMGDSYMEGVGVPYPQTFAGLVQEALEPNGIEVLNAGVASYCPVIYYAKTKHLMEEAGLGFDEVVLFLDIGDIQNELELTLDHQSWVIDDVKTKNTLSRNPREPVNQPRLFGLVEFIRNHTTLFRFLGRTVKRWLHGSGTGYDLNSFNSMWTIDPEIFEEIGRPGLQRARENMTRLSHLLKEKQIPLTLAVYPYPDQIVHRDLESIQVIFWKDWASEHEIDFLNLFPYFIHSEDPFDVLDRYFINGLGYSDAHWNVEGHRLVAGVFLDFLRSKKENLSTKTNPDHPTSDAHVSD